MKKLFLFLILCAYPVYGQTSVTGRITTGTLANRPATCSVSDQYNTTDGNGSFLCGPVNTWAVFGVGGSGTPGGVSLDAQCNLVGAFSNCAGTTVNQKGDQIFYGPNPGIDIRAYGARAVSSIPTATATCTSGSPNITLNSASTFQNGDNVVIYGCGTSTVHTPSAPTVTPIKAASQTMTLFDVNDSGGGTQYCYQIMSRTFLGGTSVSTETCTATGASTLGLLTNSITSVSLSNNIATYVTSGAHKLIVGELVRISGVVTLEIQANSYAIPAYNGWFTVATTPDNTHFTVYLNYDTRAGAVAAGTGGTVNYWAGNKITAVATTNNYEYYVYGRVTGGTKTLIGVMQPQPFGTTCAALFQFGDTTCLTFDDFGTGVLIAAPFSPSYIPTTVPSAGTTNDMLLTKIVSGAGTTNIVAANNASNSISGIINFDDAQALLAAWNVAATTGTSGSIIIPSSGNVNNYYPFFAPINIAPQGSVQPNIQQSGDVQLREPIVFTAFTKWTGIPGGTQGGSVFSQQVQPSVRGYSATPAFYVAGGAGMNINNIHFLEQITDSAIVYLQDNGGIPTSFFRDVSWSNNGGATHSNIAAVFRGGGGADIQFIDTTAAASQNGAFTGYADTTPVMHFNQLSNVKFDWLYLSGGGITFFPNAQGSGMYVKANEVYCQACFMPVFSIGATGSGLVNAKVSNYTADTVYDFNPLFADYVNAPIVIDADTGGNVNLISSGGNVSGGTNNVIDSKAFGNQVAGNMGTLQRDNRLGVKDGTFGTSGILLGSDDINRIQRLGQGYSLFTATGPYTQPNCVVSAGGSLPVGTYYIAYAPVFNATNSEGTSSQYCTATTAGGNLTITATLPATIPGSTTTNWYTSGTTPTTGQMNFCGFGPFTATLVLSSAICSGAGSGSSGAAWGPAGITKGIVSGQNVWVGVANISSTATQTRALTLPDIDGYIPTSSYKNSAYDNFIRANGAIGANWAVTTGSLSVSGNTIKGGSGGANNDAAYTASPFSPNQFAQLTIVTLNGANDFPGPAVLNSASAANFYDCVENTTNIYIQRVAAGSNSNLTNTAVTGAPGDIIRIEAFLTPNSSPQSVTLTCFQNGVQKLQITDTTYTSGNPGINMYGAVATAKNWSGGNWNPLAHLNIEQDFSSTQHFDAAVTVGNNASITGTLANGLVTASNNLLTLGTVCTNGEIALSAGWQSTGSATVTAVAGTGQTCSWTITTGTTTAANPTVTDTLTNALPTATTVCELNIHGGTHVAVAGESFNQTTLSATAPIFTANFIPTAAGTTYFVTRRCGP
jgi:hypothetical protein